MGANHTSGPWKAMYNDSEGEIVIGMASYLENSWHYQIIHKVVVAENCIEPTDADFEEAIANAHLMAAAPDMLEALEAVEWGDDWFCPVCCKPNTAGHDDNCLIGNALKKARGKHAS